MSTCCHQYPICDHEGRKDIQYNQNNHPGLRGYDAIEDIGKQGQHQLCDNDRDEYMIKEHNRINPPFLLSDIIF